MTNLRFLADESCDYSVVRALRGEGYDVIAVSEITSRSDDQELLELANQEQRILLTEDKDFGWLVFATLIQSPGVILIRFPGYARDSLPKVMTRLVIQQGEKLVGAFVVVQPGHIRIRHKPEN
jgi:predicted nuclease of predicted toxin-antitoxin system